MDIVLLDDIKIAIKESLVDGEGLRVVVFLCGCSNYCENCQNKNSWDINNGVKYEIDYVYKYISSLLDDGDYDGITLSGGDPLYQEKANEELLKKLKDKYPNLNIWLYTGSIYEDVKEKIIMKYIDVIVDGPFIYSKKGNFRFKGSENQRIIKLK